MKPINTTPSFELMIGHERNFCFTNTNVFLETELQWVNLFNPIVMDDLPLPTADSIGSPIDDTDLDENYSTPSKYFISI